MLLTFYKTIDFSRPFIFTLINDDTIRDLKKGIDIFFPPTWCQTHVKRLLSKDGEIGRDMLSNS